VKSGRRSGEKIPREGKAERENVIRWTEVDGASGASRMTDVPYSMRDCEPTTDSFLSVDRTHCDQRGSSSIEASNDDEGEQRAVSSLHRYPSLAAL